jgi:hypothetical protein
MGRRADVYTAMRRVSEGRGKAAGLDHQLAGWLAEDRPGFFKALLALEKLRAAAAGPPPLTARGRRKLVEERMAEARKDAEEEARLRAWREIQEKARQEEEHKRRQEALEQAVQRRTAATERAEELARQAAEAEAKAAEAEAKALEARARAQREQLEREGYGRADD